MKKIAVFTGTRAEYGLLYWLMREIQANEGLELQVIVGGSHLAIEHGGTWKQIQADGFDISAKVHMQVSGDNAVSVTKSMGVGLIGMADALDRLSPDILVLLGDRYEALVAAQAAMVAKIPIAHIHGGEATEGLIDEAIRHSITKMSHLHFVASTVFRNRVIQLGESPDKVWVVGAAGLDNIDKLPRSSCEELSADLGISIERPLFLVTYHPVTLSDDDSGRDLQILLNTIDKFAGTVVITGVNADAGGQVLRDVCSEFVEARSGRAIMVDTLGARRYLSLMAHADIVVGNSSSGLLEAPAVGTPSVDVGERQAGRLRAPSVIHADPDEYSIEAAICKALSAEHRRCTQRLLTPYGKPGAAKRICQVLATQQLQGLLNKKFFNLNIEL